MAGDSPAGTDEDGGGVLDAAVFRDIYHSVNDAIFVHDGETGEILDVNETACELYVRLLASGAAGAERRRSQLRRAAVHAGDRGGVSRAGRKR